MFQIFENASKINENVVIFSFIKTSGSVDTEGASMGN